MVGASIRLELRCLSFADYRFGILSCFTGLCRKLFDNTFVVGFRLLLHSSPFSLQALDFYLVVCEFVVLILFHTAGLTISFAVEVFQVLPVFDVDCKPFRYQESEPLESLWVEANLGESILPVWNTKVHDHQSEIISESIRDKKPLARQILEPNLWLGAGASIHQSKSTVLDIGVNIERVDVFSVIERTKCLAIKSDENLLFFFFIIIVFIARILVIISTDSRESEVFSFDFLDVSELVQVHTAEGDTLIIFLDLPVQAQPV